MKILFQRMSLRAGLLLAAAAGASLAFAQPMPEGLAEATAPEARVEVGLGQSDNLVQNAEGLRSDLAILGIGFAARRFGQLMRGALAVDVDYFKYGADGLAVDDEVVGSADGAVELHIVPDRFRWNVRQSFGQLRTDPRAPVGPGNRERTTITATGPELAFPLGQRNALEMSAELSERRFERTEALDSQLKTMRLGISRAISPVTRVAIAVEQSENEFDSDPETYKFRIAWLEYRKELASGEAVVSAGRGNVEIAGDTEPTVVARLAWGRAVGARSRLDIWGGRELTDAGGLFAGGGTVTGQTELSSLEQVARTTDGRLRGVALSRSPLRRESAGVRFSMLSESASLSISLATAQDRFSSDVALDNDLTTVEVSGARALGQRWRAEASLARWDQEFTVDGGDNEDQVLSFSVARVLARNSDVTLTLQRNRRVGDVFPFDENVFVVSVGRNFSR